MLSKSTNDYNDKNNFLEGYLFFQQHQDLTSKFSFPCFQIFLIIISPCWHFGKACKDTKRYSLLITAQWFTFKIIQCHFTIRKPKKNYQKTIRKQKKITGDRVKPEGDLKLHNGLKYKNMCSQWSFTLIGDKSFICVAKQLWTPQKID